MTFSVDPTQIDIVHVFLFENADDCLWLRLLDENAANNLSDLNSF